VPSLCLITVSAHVILNLASVTDFRNKLPYLFVLDDMQMQKEIFKR